jgi:phenylacetic acid degradation operon negative regulatory protein
VVDPFDAGEIFPDVTDQVRMPRQQNSRSPQGLAVTMIADYTLGGRAWLPTAAIVALLREFEVTTAAARAALSRLTRRGVLETSRQGRKSSHRLTDAAAVNLSIGGTSIATFGTERDSWEGLWTVVVFTVPKEEKAQRSALRAQLRWRGYAPLYDGVWVSPHPLTEDAYAEIARYGTITAFRAEQLLFQSESTRQPIEAWDLAEIRTEYDTFVQRWDPLLPRIRAGRIAGAAAVRARTEVMDTYRRFPALDPLLPSGLMPPNWPRTRARGAFLAVYDGLAGPALDHVRAVISQVGEVPRPELRTHAVAEMATGVGPQPGHLE